MLDRSRQAYRHLHWVIDSVAIATAMVAAYFAHTLLLEFTSLVREPASIRSYIYLLLATPPLWLLLTATMQLDRTFEEPLGHFQLIARLLRLHAVGLVLMAAVLFVTRGVVNRSMVFLFMTGSYSLMYGVRVVIGARVRRLHERGVGQERLLFVGHSGCEMERYLARSKENSLPPRVLGRLDDRRAKAERPDAPELVPMLGSLEELEDRLESEAVDHVLFFPPYNKPESVPGALRACEERGVRASFCVDMVQVARAAPRLVFLGEQPFVSFDVAPKSSAWLAVKHGTDILVASVAILLLSPVLITAALAILVTMGRPILFVQERSGLYGRRFQMAKFRTMVVDAEEQKASLEESNEMTGPVFKVTKDPRITRLGKWLRRTSIDELPQLFNVLLGHMSLVGPRPLPVSEQQRISGLYRRRLTMRPGITGLWQVSGRSNIDFDEWMALDLRYVDQWSLGLDSWILLRTVPAVLFGRGAR